MPSLPHPAVVLADTNVVSEILRREPNDGVRDWAVRQPRLAVSVITIDEVAFGFGKKPNASAEAEFEAYLRSSVEVLLVTLDVARRAGALRAERRRAGRVCTQADMLIAATALMHGLTLVTRNTRHFEACGVTLLNPFT